jgi:hypothetical protein
MTTTPRRIACFCETTFDAELPTSGDMTGDPEIGQLILDGSFMSVTCPGCGRRLTPEYPFRLTGAKGFGEIFLVPEADRGAYVRGKLPYDPGSPARIVVGFPELVEKVLIAGRGLDDRVIEMMKYYLLTGSAPQSDGEPEKEIGILYRGTEEGRHVLNIVGLKAGEVGIARLAPELYARIAADVETRVQEDPFLEFCVPPWVSLRKITGVGG